MENDKLYKAFQRGKYWRLGASVLIDLLGMATYLLPGVAEVADVIWAPIAGIAHFMLFRNWPGAAGGLVTLAEELLPATDWIPSVTLNWVYHYMIREEHTLRKFLKKRERIAGVIEESKAKALK